MTQACGFRDMPNFRLPGSRANYTQVPELRIYRFWDKPVGPHPVAMFEVNVFTPAQFGAFVSWLAVWRGPLSALIHPNMLPGEGESENEAALRDHSERAIWMGERFPLNYSLFQTAIENERRSQQ